MFEYNSTRYADPGSFFVELLAVSGEANKHNCKGPMVLLKRDSATSAALHIDHLLAFG